VRDLGGTVALVDHDALTAGDMNTAIRRVPRGLGHAWYRGWMITSSGYQALAASRTWQTSTMRLSTHRATAIRCTDLPGVEAKAVLVDEGLCHSWRR
jgi:hypothetical protein